MNRKNKKNKNKPPNPVPPQESAQKADINPETVEKTEERVPEIVSEIVIQENKEDDAENPKKPKRNRGKKKKNDHDDEKGDEHGEALEASDIKADAPTVAPSNRKKKNKPKINEPITEVRQEDKKSEITSEVPETTKSPEPDDGKSKKKNKKNKKRSDSERSDKAEELSCTAAFQKILQPPEPRVDKKDAKIDKNIQETKPPQTIMENVPKSESKPKEAIPLPPPPPPQEFLTRIQPVAEKPESGEAFEEQKGKKKKNKKKELEEQDLITALILGEAKVDVKPVLFAKSSDSRKQGEKKEITRDIEVKTEPTKEPEKSKGNEKDSVSLKDIIVPQPSEKEKTEGKQTGTSDKEAETKNIIDLKSLEHQKQEVPTEAKSELKTTDKDTTLHKDTKSQADLGQADVKVADQTKSDKTVKPKAKIAKPIDKKGQNKQNVDPQSTPIITSETKSEETKPDSKSEIKTSVGEIQIIEVAETLAKEKDIPDSHTSISVETKQDTGTKQQEKPLEKLKTTDEVKKHILPESIDAKTRSITPSKNKQSTLDTAKFESPRKNKKSPTAQRKFENKAEPKLTTPEPIAAKTEEKTETKETKRDSPVTDKTFGPIPDEISLSDIEKDVSITSDITPDQIEPPRPSSEQLMDPNNNTFIQEISTTRLEVSSEIPDAPFITGSEGPINIDVKTAESQVTPIGSSVSKEEKTDLKSKVIEVNQDMEELKLSIERSLAEFTSLEKDETERRKREDLIIVTCAEVKPEGKPESLIVDTSKLAKIDEAQEKTPKIQPDVKKPLDLKAEIDTETKVLTPEPTDVPIPPQRKDNKGKNKSKKKGKQEAAPQQTDPSSETSTSQEHKETTKDAEKEEKRDKQEKAESKKEGKKQSDADQKLDSDKDANGADTEPIENFEDALTSSVDDVNKTFEMIANDCKEDEDQESRKEDNKNQSPPSQPKNLKGHNDIPVPSNRTDYKKERNKTPNTKQAKVKIKDSVDIEKTKINKECQTSGKPRYGRNKTINESVTCVTNENEEYVYKYSFRKVFLSNICHVCKKDLRDSRITCNFCYLIFYCSEKHKAEDVAQHSGLCFAISTIAHLKGQKHIYADAAGANGHSYRLLRMQAIVSAEKILKRRLEPWEQEALLYPRVCADPSCREWHQGKLSDCSGCGQISYCTPHPDHLPKIHARWCKSYTLYQKLVIHQLTVGRLEPRIPSKILTMNRITDNINRLLADMYDEKIDMNDIQYASLTQLATAPLTTAYSYQLYKNKMDAITNGVQKAETFTIHVVGAELQFEADSLNKWETFFLHLKPDIEDLRVVLVGPELNPSNLPLDLLGKIKLCPSCRVERRRLTFHFQDKILYHDYYNSNDFITPDIVCAFNPSIHRSTNYIRNDTWSPTINCILRTKKPFLITSYTMTELQRDVATVKKCAEEPFNLVSEPKFNPFASVRPDRNFISDDEIPLLFKNYCYSVLIGAF